MVFMLPVRVALDTGSMCNFFKRNAIPPNWQAHILNDAIFSYLGDASENHMTLEHVVQLRVRFGKALYYISFC